MAGKLKEVEEQLTKDLKETTVPLLWLAKKYGVSKQAISLFIHRKGITRPKRPKKEKPKHSETECPICQGLLRMAGKPRSDFICKQTLREELGLQPGKLAYHLSHLRNKKLVSPKFGQLVSKRAELAYEIYFKGRLPIGEIGRQVGLRNFSGMIGYHKTSGWNVPAPLFKYDKNAQKSAVKRKKEQ